VRGLSQLALWSQRKLIREGSQPSLTPVKKRDKRLSEAGAFWVQKSTERKGSRELEGRREVEITSRRGRCQNIFETFNREKNNRGMRENMISTRVYATRSLHARSGKNTPERKKTERKRRAGHGSSDTRPGSSHKIVLGGR